MRFVKCKLEYGNDTKKEKPFLARICKWITNIHICEYSMNYKSNIPID